VGSRFGTVDRWIETFLRSDAYAKLSAHSRSDYREVARATGAHTVAGGRVGTLPVASLSRAAVDKLYDMLRSNGAVQQANYPIDVARRAWKVIAREYTGSF